MDVVSLLAKICTFLKRELGHKRDEIGRNTDYGHMMAKSLILCSLNSYPKPKSLYRSRAGSNFYGTEYEIQADFGPVGNTEKKNWADYEQLLRSFFSCFQWQIFFF